eukprot:13862216-Heterocapsa_arctica.AAC.1
MVESIYADKTFLAQEAGKRSCFHPQRTGICQGCPLSQFLFVIVMTVLIHDANRSSSAESGRRRRTRLW